MSNATDPNAFLMGGTVPSAEFKKRGDTITGTVSEPPVLRQQTEMNTNALKFWKDGNPMMQLVVTLATDERDDEIEDDDGSRRLYVKFNLQKAIAAAVRTAKAKMLEIGGTLTVTYTGDGEQKTRGFSPPKLYTASYSPPADSFLDKDQNEDPEAAPRGMQRQNLDAQVKRANGNSTGAADALNAAKVVAWRAWKSMNPKWDDATAANELGDYVALRFKTTKEKLGAAQWREMVSDKFAPTGMPMDEVAMLDGNEVPF